VSGSTTGGGHKPESELDRLSNILKVSNDLFSNIPWTDADWVHKLIAKDISNESPQTRRTRMPNATRTSRTPVSSATWPWRL
jgi:hypothetical protein